MNNNSEKEKKIFKCEKCNLSFKHNFILMKHYETGLHKTGKRKTRSDKKEKMSCEVCESFSTANETELKKHILKYHKTEEERMKEYDFYCVCCKVGFFNKDKYEKHKTLKSHEKKTLYNKPKKIN